MKTNYFNLRQISLYSVLGIFGLGAASCSSYQNTSSYNNDGIYGSVPRDSNNEPVYTYNDGNVQQYTDGNNSGQNMNYKEYFSSLQDEYQPVPTDYGSENDTVVRTEGYNSYAGWGEDTSDVTVNVYGGYGWNNWYSPYWGAGYGWGPGWSLGLGWGYGGWGWGGWGWGWNSWYSPYWGGWGYGGWYAPYYGHNHHYYNNYRGRSTAYYNGTRGSYDNNRYSNTRYNNTRRSGISNVNGRRQNAAAAGRSYTNGRTYTTSRNATTVRSRGDAQYNNTSRTAPATRSTSRSNYSNSSRSNNTYSAPRTSSPSRSSTISPSRSSSGSFGGGRSSGGGGGSRGGGGGRRR